MAQLPAQARANRRLASATDQGNRARGRTGANGDRLGSGDCRNMELSARVHGGEGAHHLNSIRYRTGMFNYYRFSSICRKGHLNSDCRRLVCSVANGTARSAGWANQLRQAELAQRLNGRSTVHAKRRKTLGLSRLTFHPSRMRYAALELDSPELTELRFNSCQPRSRPSPTLLGASTALPGRRRT